MPTVGKGKRAKKFPYTSQGEAAAEAYAKKSGTPMKKKPAKKK